MKKIIICIFLSISIGSTNVARADIWGADGVPRNARV